MKKTYKSYISALLAVLLSAILLLTSCAEPEQSSDVTTVPSEGTTLAPSDTTATPEGTTSSDNTTTAAPSGNSTTAAPSGTTDKPSGNTTTAQSGSTTTAPDAGSTTASNFDGGNPTNKPANEDWWSNYTTYVISQNLTKFNIQGRTREISGGMTSDWAASGFEFLADFESTVYVIASASAKCEYAVFVDGVRVGVLTLNAGNNLQYELPISTSGSGKIISLVRVTRPKDAQVSFAKILLNGEVKEWGQTSRKLIEFVGDSITCGCGLVDPSKADYDASKTYAYKLATSLGCDYSMISEGGIGVSASTDWHNGNTISTIYGTAGYYRDSSVEYTATRKANLVVVNLNTNDSGRATDKAEYQNDAKDIISKIRAMHGANVKIVWVVGHMIDSNATVNQWLAEVITELGGESAGIYTVTVTTDTSGGATHPSQASHDAVAATLKNFIETKNLLG